MKKERKDKVKYGIYSIFIRYIILILISFSNLWIFYFLLTPLTIYPVYFILNIFFDVNLIGNVIFFLSYNFSVEIIEACIAGYAYYLFAILILSTPKIKANKRIKMLAFSFSILLIANILRIVMLLPVYTCSPDLFDILHKISWYFLSVIFVVGVWFLEVKKFEIKEIPFYSDLKFLLKQIQKSSS